MAGTLTISTLSDGTNSTSSTNCIKGSAKAWVNFAGSSGTIAGSYNVSSVTRNSTGDFTVTYTTAMPNTNYTVFTSSVSTSAVGNPPYQSSLYPINSTTTQRITFFTSNASAFVDPTSCCFAVLSS
jgi:hypothetical protein